MLSFVIEGPQNNLCNFWGPQNNASYVVLVTFIYYIDYILYHYILIRFTLSGLQPILLLPNIQRRRLVQRGLQLLRHHNHRHFRDLYIRERLANSSEPTQLAQHDVLDWNSHGLEGRRMEEKVHHRLGAWRRDLHT